MKTPQEFEPLSLWMGWRKRNYGAAGTVWEGDHRELHGSLNKTSLTDAECIEALNRLVGKWYEAHLVYAYGSGWYLRILRDISTVVYLQPLPTIHEAVEAALLQLIAAERNRECEVCGLSVPNGGRNFYGKQYSPKG